MRKKERTKGAGQYIISVSIPFGDTLSRKHHLGIKGIQHVSCPYVNIDMTVKLARKHLNSKILNLNLNIAIS